MQHTEQYAPVQKVVRMSGSGIKRLKVLAVLLLLASGLFSGSVAQPATAQGVGPPSSGSKPQPNPQQAPPDGSTSKGGSGPAVPLQASFSDVYASDNYYAGVEALANRTPPPISGYPNGTFLPNNDATRGQISKIIVLSMGWPINTSGGPHFSDVPFGSTFYNYIETAYNHSIIQGYGDPTCSNVGLPAPCFLPYNTAYRGQFMKMLVLAMGWSWYDPGYSSFADVPNTDTYYGYIESAYFYGAIWVFDPNCENNGCRTFQTYSYIKRGDLCQIIHRAQGTGNQLGQSNRQLVNFWGEGIGYRAYWTSGSLRVYYSQFYDYNQGGWLVTPNKEDQSELVESLAYNNPCGVTLGANTLMYGNRQYYDATIYVEQPGTYMINPQDVVYGGITNIGRNYIYPRLTGQAVTAADPAACSGGIVINWNVDLP